AQRRPWPADSNEWNAILILTLTIMALPYALLFWAEQYVTSSMSAILFSASPLAVSLITPVMMHRKVPRRAVYAMVTAFGGILVIFYKNPSTNRLVIIGGAAVLVSMLLTSWSVVYAKQRLRNVDSVVATGLQSLLGSVVLFWGTWALEAHRHARWTTRAIVAMAFLTIFGSAAAFVIYYWLLKNLQPYQSVHHQFDYSTGCDPGRAAGWRAHSFAYVTCGCGGAGLRMVGLEGGNRKRTGR
ncbi:MAG: DMT family transporter, partial [Candidatus Angelobacter sp.]